MRDDGGKNMGKRREYQKRACCYRQLLCAAAAAGERPRRSCASIWHFFGAVGVEISRRRPVSKHTKSRPSDARARRPRRETRTRAARRHQHQSSRRCRCSSHGTVNGTEPYLLELWPGAGLVKNQNNRGRISNAAPVAVGFKLLTAARVDPTTLPNGSTTRSEHATR